MAAFDLFRTVTGELSDDERTAYSQLLQRAQADLLAARSEEARVRIVHRLIAELHEHRAKGSHRSMTA